MKQAHLNKDNNFSNAHLLRLADYVAVGYYITGKSDPWLSYACRYAQTNRHNRYDAWMPCSASWNNNILPL